MTQYLIQNLIHTRVLRGTARNRTAPTQGYGGVPLFRWLFVGSLCVVLCAPLTAWAQSLQDSGLELPGLWAGEAAWGDYDDDGDVDLALIGEIHQDGICTRIAQIYRNDSGILVEDVAQTQRLSGVYFGDLGWADYDSDGDLDLGIVGWDAEDIESMSLYRSEPGGTPGEVLLTFDVEQTDGTESVFSGVRYATMSWVDYDNDGDLDLVVSGMASNGTSLTRAYRNEDGHFQEDELNSEALINVHNGDLAWADYDSDGDLDLALSGETVFAEGEIPRVTEFYANGPVGILDLDEDVRVEPAVKGGSLAWADYDTDGNPDLAVSGRDAQWISILQLYQNRPAGVLSLDGSFNTNVSALDGGLDWIDYDNDGFLELAVSGRTRQSNHVASVFGNNDGTVTSASVEQSLVGLAGGSTAWGDYDGDGRADLVLSGVDESGERRSILYGNLGTPEANQAPDSPESLQPVEVTSSRARFSWAPGEDVESSALSYVIRVGTEPGAGDIVSAATPLGPGTAGFKTSYVLHRFFPPDTYYWSVRSVDGSLATSSFTQEDQFIVGRFVSSDQLVRSLDESAMTWGDVDNDGDDDLVIMGKNRSGEPQTLAYINRDGVMTQELNVGLKPLQKGDLAWGDYDNDGDLDLMSTGEDPAGNRANHLYRTDVVGPDEVEFTEVDTIRSGLSNSSADWGDVDNDGDIDLLLMGQSGQVEGGLQRSFTQLWTNDGAGSFSASSSADLVGLNNGEALFGDVDGDGDLDVMTTGVDTDGDLQAKLYENFLPDPLRDIGLSVPGMQSSDIALGDFDRDGDLDLAAGGLTATGLSSSVYTNDGVGGFEQLLGVDLPGIQGGDLAWADFDNDQDLDLVLAGNTGGLDKVLQLYENTIGRVAPDASFILLNLPVLQGVDFSSVSMADIDSDGDLDLVSSGKNSGASQSTSVNDNLAAQQLIVNRPPGTPSDLIAGDSADRVTLSWQAGSDDADPPAESLTYNARVGTVPEADDVLSGAIALGHGNIGARLMRDLSGLTSGTYYWSVQTVDVGGARSAWRDGDPFIIDTVNPTLGGFLLNKDQFGLGQTVTLGLSFLDEHSGVNANAEVAPLVKAEIGGTPFPFSQLLFSGRTWSGELEVTADMPSGEAVLSVSGLVDLKGNSLADTVIDTFVVDTDLPVIVDRLPSEDATGVAQSATEIAIGFSEAIDPATITVDNFAVTRANIPVPLRIERPADTSDTVTLIFEETLRPGSLYNVEVSAAIQDLAANRPADAISWSFSTQIPQLTATDPMAESTDVPLDDGRLSATFDSGLDVSALTDAIEILRDEQAVDLRDDAVFDTETNTLSFEIDEGLLPGSRYRVVLSGLLAGPLGAVSQGDFDWRFTTAVPQISSLTPANGDTTVSVEDDDIRAIFDQRLDPVAALTASNIRVTEQGLPIETDDVEYNPDTGSLSFSPEDGLKAGTRYAVTIDGSVGGLLRQEIGDYSWDFSTAVPMVESTAPLGGEIVSTADLTAATVQFSVPLDDDQVIPANFILLREGAAVSLREGDPVVLGPGLYGLAETDGWKVGSSYAISIATTVQGPLGPGQVLGWQFQTTVPDTISVSPAAGSDDVDVGISGITALFDDLIDEGALQAEGNVVLAREGRPIEITDPIGYDRAAGEVTIPVSDLRAGTPYQVLIASDVAGPRAAGEFRWGFSTRIPTIASTVPPDNSSIAAGPRRIQLIFSSNVDERLARDPDNYRLTSGGQSIELTAAEFLYDDGSFTVSLPEIEFLSGTGYDLIVNSRLGGPLAQRPDDEFRFQTDLPTVVETEPVAASEGVVTSHPPIRLVFSGPVANQDATGFQLRARPLAQALANSDAPFGLLSIAGFGLDPTGSEVNFAPEGGFRPFTEYQVLVDPSVFGQLAIDGFTLAFSTAARIGNTASGGTISNADRSVELYFPPNALSGGVDGEVVIQSLEATDAGKVITVKPTQATLTQIGQAWEIDGLGASLMKPATLTMRYTDQELGSLNAARLGIFRLDGTDWVRIGGTADPTAAQVRTTIEEFAVYALFEDLSAQVGALAIAGIEVQPQAFAPSGGRGNMRQETDISFDLSGPADVTVRVYSASGRLERVIARDTPMGQGRNSLVWDGRDEDRKTVGSGLYIVVVSTGDEQAEKVVAVVR